MSAPNTDVPRQTRRHRGPLVGIVVVLLFVGLTILALTVWNGRSSTTGTSAVDGVPDVTGPAAQKPAAPQPAPPSAAP